MARQYNKNYLQGGVGTNVFTEKIFTSWDYGITDDDAYAIKQQSITTDIQVSETLNFYFNHSFIEFNLSSPKLAKTVPFVF